MADSAIGTEVWAPRVPTILVVEDEVLLRFVLADELRMAGYRVVEAISADEALAVLRGGAYIDLVVTDVQMPGSLDGHALARAVRSEFPGIKIVIASAHRADGGSVADASFLKPYNLDELSAAIKNLLA